MAAGSLRNVGEPKFRTPEVVSIGNNPPPTTPPGMFLAPIPPDTTWLDLQNREYSEFQISVDSSFHITTLHANEGARFRLFIYRSNDTEITVDINPWLDEVIKVPGTSVSKVYVLNVECYLVPGEEVLRYKVTNLIFDHQERKDKTWSSSKIKETINAIINDESVSLTGTWSSTKLKLNIDAKQDKIGNSLEVDEVVRKSNLETGGLTFISKSIHKTWGDREDEKPTFTFVLRVYDDNGNIVHESIPFFSDANGKLQVSDLNASFLSFNNSKVATESFVNAAIQAVTDLMSTDAERIAAINELTQNYSAADDQLEQTLTAALATKAGKAVNEEISGIYNFLNGLLINGVSLSDLFLGKNASAQNALKFGNLLPSQFLRSDIDSSVNGIATFNKPPVLGNKSSYSGTELPSELYGIQYGKGQYLNGGSGISLIAVSDVARGFHFHVTAEEVPNIFIRNAREYWGDEDGWSDFIKLWHDGNDGAESGLDADKLDGLESSQFLRSDVDDQVNGILTFKKGNPIIYLEDTTQSKKIGIANIGNSFLIARYTYVTGAWESTLFKLNIDNGNVGIGTLATSEKLVTKGNGLFQNEDGNINVSVEDTRYSPNKHKSKLFPTTLHFSRWSGGSAQNNWTISNHNDTLQIKFGQFSKGDTDSIGVEKFTFNSAGDLILVGTLSQGSDRRLKSNIQPLTPRGELNPVTFIKNGKPDLGFIAQEVKELYPELVAGEETEDNYLSLNYSQLTAVLYAELKELRAEVKHLKQLIQNETNA